MVNQFYFSSIPQIIFGPGKISELALITQKYGKCILLIIGGSSLKNNKKFSKIAMDLESSGKAVYRSVIDKEPSTKMIDNIVSEFKNNNIDLVLSVGGGSVLDAGKAISAMLTVSGSVSEYLEGNTGARIHPGTRIPFIAIPTTAGTGSEATKNAVISEVGKSGFKKSLRHENFIPEIALIDPELTITCPKKITAFSGMDAFTQLLESYVSTISNPMSDAFAVSGLEHISRFLERAYNDGSDLEARSGMAYAATCSGIALANAGLGTVHGFASSIGGRFDIAHGIICGTLMAVASDMTINKLKIGEINSDALEKYTRVGQIFHKSDNRSSDFYLDYLISELYRLTDKLKIPKLSQVGFDENEITTIAKKTSCKNNPVHQSVDELVEMLEKRI